MTIQQLTTTVKRGGPFYSGLYLLRTVVDHVRDHMDSSLSAMEQRKQLVGPWTISARRFTSVENRALWNTHDWSALGEEWTTDDAWKNGVVRDLLEPNVPAGTTVVEVGPGGGRWTEYLQQRAKKLYIVDVADRPLALCRERFADCSNIDYLLTEGNQLAVPDGSVDVVWSYDVFVHINPNDAQSYFKEIQRVLKPGGRAIIHHPGPPLSGDRKLRWRSDLTEGMVSEFCERNGLRVLSRSHQYVNDGDSLSIIEKPARS